MSKDENSESSNTPKSGTKSIQDFGKEKTKNLSITDYTKPTPPPPKPTNKDKK